MSAIACSATVPVEGELVDSDRRRPCPTPAARLLTWSDGDERPYCSFCAAQLVDASSVRQTYHAR